jgi:SAM-dependent methyltransferase
MADRAAYDRIGVTYSSTRRPDPRIRDAIWSALGDAASVINVGAGAGAYEPPETVLAVEPSQVMIDQRPPGSAPAVAACAECLPVPDGFADAAMALLTVHHWSDVPAGIAELRRVARRTVILTWDQRVTERFWLSREYLSQLSTYDEGAWARSGADRGPTSTPPCGPASPPWPRLSPPSAPASSASAPTSNRANGTAATPISCVWISSTSATAC